METGWFKMYNNRAFSGQHSTVGINCWNSLYSKTYVYCQTTGTKSVPIDLPISHPFYLLPYGSSECQQVKWMVATKQWIQYATNNYASGSYKDGTIPYVTVGTKAQLGITVYYCYYESKL